MKFTLSWLKEHLDTNASLEEICDKLTMIGLEVEEVIDLSKTLAPFTIAEIKEAISHPNAERLKLCQVFTGKEILQIVCGATNARNGLKVVLAPIDSIIPVNQMKIKATKIRGVESNGMLCSAAELGLGEDSEGIIELPDDAPVGTSFVKYAKLNDPVIEIAITPNRGDCLGVRGIARDLAASGLGTLKPLKIDVVNGGYKSPISVEIEAPDQAPLFIGRYIKNVKNIESPDWLKKKLESIGLNPISALVDITNYLTFDFGRPAHIYDADKLNGNLKIRLAGNEKITALNDKEYALNQNMLVIADNKSPVAIAGIIGGKDSGCNHDTKNIFLEIACFKPETVAYMGRVLQINSDARYRFERSIDQGFMRNAAEYATKLIMEICGGEPSELVIAGNEYKPRSIKFNYSCVEKLTGIKVSDDKIKSILDLLGFQIKEKELIIPSWRNDISIEEDIVEEIARIVGYDSLPLLEMPMPYRKSAKIKKSDVRKKFAGRELTEVVTFSFMDQKLAGFFADIKPELVLKNSISPELSYMRPSIIPNLLTALKNNSSRGYSNLNLFEIGPVFNGIAIDKQPVSGAGIRSGMAIPKNPHDKERNVDIYDAKADLLAVIDGNVSLTKEAPKYYHPGRSGAIKLAKEILGYFGEIHPKILRYMDITEAVVGFELTEYALNLLPASKKALNISKFQAVIRDFAFLVDKNVNAESIIESIEKLRENLIQNIEIFDVYSGKNIPEGKKSFAFTVTLQASDRTLTDQEINEVSSKIIKSISEGVSGILRDN